MSTASSTANAQRPRILLQFNQHKEGSVPTIRTVQDGPTSEEEYEEDDEEEDEVDQLVSTEDEATGQAKVPMSASAAGASKPRVRSQKVSVQPPIPLSRLEGLLDSEISEAMSKEALFVLSAATDAFIKRLADTGYKKSSHMKRATVTYHDLASVIHERHELHFLQETIPQPLGLAEALRLRDTKEKNLLEPLLSTPAPARPFTISIPPHAQSLSITLPARSVSVSASASGSNAPSPRPVFKDNLPVSVPPPIVLPPPSTVQTSISTSASTSTSASKPPATKGRRKGKQQANGQATPVVNVTLSTTATETNPPTPVNRIACTLPIGDPVSATAPATAPPPQPRRMSMREPKPRRRPDDMEDPPRPPPAPPTSPVKESSDVNTGKNAAGKTRQSRAKGKGKAKADVKTTSNATGRNGVNHSHTNGHVAMTTRTTRSRRGSSAVVSQAQVVDEQQQMSVDQANEDEGTGKPLSELGGVLLDGSAATGGNNGPRESVGRTIYSSGQDGDARPTP